MDDSSIFQLEKEEQKELVFILELSSENCAIPCAFTGFESLPVMPIAHYSEDQVGGGGGPHVRLKI